MANCLNFPFIYLISSGRNIRLQWIMKGWFNFSQRFFISYLICVALVIYAMHFAIIFLCLCYYSTLLCILRLSIRMNFLGLKVLTIIYCCQIQTFFNISKGIRLLRAVEEKTRGIKLIQNIFISGLILWVDQHGPTTEIFNDR